MANYDAISALMSPVSNEDELRALADNLRKRKRAADFYSATTIKPLQQAGQQEAQDVLGTAERQGVLRQALAERQAKQAEYQADRDFTREENKLNRDANAASDERMFQRALSVAGINAAGHASGKNVLKPSAKAQDVYVQGVKLAGDVDYLDGLFSNMDESQQAQLNQPWAEIGATLVDKVLPKGVGRSLREKEIYTDPAVRNYMAAGNKMTSNLSQLAAGLTVTGYEMEDRDKWSPFAPGISQGERQVRLGNVKRDLLSRVSALREMYPQLQAFDETLGAPAAVETAAAPVDDLEQAAQEAIAQGADPAEVKRALEEMRRGQQ